MCIRDSSNSGRYAATKTSTPTGSTTWPKNAAESTSPDTPIASSRKRPGGTAESRQERFMPHNVPDNYGSNVPDNSGYAHHQPAEPARVKEAQEFQRQQQMKEAQARQQQMKEAHEFQTVS